jgi:hypothetical protein
MSLVESIGDATLTIALSFGAVAVRLLTGEMDDALRWSQTVVDLAEVDQPQKLAELKELFWQEAERNRVLPLVGGMGEQPAAMSATPMWPRLLFRPPCRPLSLRASIASTSARKPLTSQISSAKLDEGDKP